MELLRHAAMAMAADFSVIELTMTPVARTFRSRVLSVAIAIWGVLLFVLGISTALYQSPKASPTLRVGGIVAYIAILIFMILRMARARLRVLPEGVRVHNYLRNRFVPWKDIAGFSLRPWTAPFWKFIFWTPIAHVDLNDGSSVPILGIGRSSPAIWPKRARADDMIDELNRLLEAQRIGG